MGGDGGVIASNRKYMRGAGTADHTGDATRQQQKTVERQSRNEQATVLLRTCYLTGQPLQFGTQAIVTCRLGRLYHKEAAVEALLLASAARKNKPAGGNNNNNNDSINNTNRLLGSHIRKIGDLFDVRFNLVQGKPTCPVTGSEMNGKLPVSVLVPGGAVNVVNERAFEIMGMDDVVTEYGPMERKIRLAPNADEHKEIKAQVEKEQAEEEIKKQLKKEKKNKRKRSVVEANLDDDERQSTLRSVEDRSITVSKSSAQKANALADIFTKKDASSRHQRPEDLFAR